MADLSLLSILSLTLHNCDGPLFSSLLKGVYTCTRELKERKELSGETLMFAIQKEGHFADWIKRRGL